MTARIGSLFSGAGGLDLAVESVFGGRTVWQSELHPAASKLLALRFPDAPNHGDITRVDWKTVEPVDVLCGGFPCQDVSAAGRRAGIADGTRSGLWVNFATAIAELRPKLAVIENVRGLLSAKADRPISDPDRVGRAATAVDRDGSLRAIGAVLGDLSDLGYDARWTTVSAASVGAPHKRERVFILAYPVGCEPERRRWIGGTDSSALVKLLPAPTVAEANGGRRYDAGRASRPRSGGPGLFEAISALLPTPGLSDIKAGMCPETRAAQGHQVNLVDAIYGVNRDGMQWGKYAAAIDRWEAIWGPHPTVIQPNRIGNPQMTAAFPEWMMGWRRGWATDVPDLTRSDMLRLTGNGVCTPQAEAALRQLLDA